MFGDNATARHIRHSVCYLPGRNNRVADALSRLTEDIKNSESHNYAPPERLKNEEFLLAVNDPQTDTLTAVTNGWTTYCVTYETEENQKQGVFALNPDASIFIPNIKQTENAVSENNVVAPVMSPRTGEKQNPQSSYKVPVPVKRSARIAERRARAVQQQQASDGHSAHGSEQDMQAIHADSDTQGETAKAQGDHAVMQEEPDEKDEMDEFTRWAQDLQSPPTETDYESFQMK